MIALGSLLASGFPGLGLASAGARAAGEELIAALRDRRLRTEVVGNALKGAMRNTDPEILGAELLMLCRATRAIGGQASPPDGRPRAGEASPLGASAHLGDHRGVRRLLDQRQRRIAEARVCRPPALAELPALPPRAVADRVDELLHALDLTLEETIRVEAELRRTGQPDAGEDDARGGGGTTLLLEVLLVLARHDAAIRGVATHLVALWAIDETAGQAQAIAYRRLREALKRGDDCEPESDSAEERPRDHRACYSASVRPQSCGVPELARAVERAFWWEGVAEAW